MRRRLDIVIISIIAIIFIPASITLFLGNNEKIARYKSDKINEKGVNGEKDNLQEELIAMLAQDIPIKYEQEALKTQAVIARSYLATKGKSERPYMTKEDMKRIWANDYNDNYLKVKKAVEDTKNIILTYNKEPVQAIYHPQNAGITQDPMDIWELEIPYIESVESKWDSKSKDLSKEKKFNTEEVCALVNDKYKENILKNHDLESQIQIVERTQGGYVKSIQVASQLMTGEEFRRMLDLRSACFQLKYDGGRLTIISKGLGHGVGLSQYGANEMAKEGKTYKEILGHYFPSLELDYIK